MNRLTGLRIRECIQTEDAREFVFSGDGEEWTLRVLCSWRIEDKERAITGSGDWYEPAAGDRYPEDGWDPMKGGSLEEHRLRELFADPGGAMPVIRNNTERFRVTSVEESRYGDLTIHLAGGCRLRMFPSGSCGEFWRLARKGAREAAVIFDPAPR